MNLSTRFYTALSQIHVYLTKTTEIKSTNMLMPAGWWWSKLHGLQHTLHRMHDFGYTAAQSCQINELA